MQAEVAYQRVPKLAQVETYLELGCSPGGAQRNFDSYGHKLAPMSETQRNILCDPQTSGGLLVAVSPDGEAEFLNTATRHGFQLDVIGELKPATSTSRFLIEVI